MKQIPNFRHLIAFITVAENFSIRKASEKIYLSQPAITQAIVKIEKQLDAKLFERKTNGMKLTSLGEIFYFRVKRSVETIEFSLQKVCRNKNCSLILLALKTTHLRAALAVSDAKNYSEAGRKISISQSSLYRACRELEEHLDVNLFEKTSLGVNSTKVGKVIIQAIKLAFQEIYQAFDEINSKYNIGYGNITIGSLPLASACVLPTAVNQFITQYPSFNAQVIDGVYKDLLEHLREGDIDVIIGALRFPAPSYDVHQETLFLTDNVILARNEHPLCKQNQVNLTDLKKYHWVVPRIDAPGRRIFETMFTYGDQEAPTQIIEASSHMFIRELLMDSNMLTILPRQQVTRDLSNKVLGVVNFNINDKPRAIGLTFRKNWQGTTYQAKFIDQLREVGLSLGN